MRIRILQGIDMASQAEGLAVAIDLFRATSTLCYLFANGARCVIPLEHLKEAYRMKSQNPDWILMGERKTRPQPGFDFGNSPAEIERIDFSGRTVIHTTTTGTRGIVRAAGEEVITGSFANCAAVVHYLQSRRVDRVSLLALGGRPEAEPHEDTICAEYIAALLRGDQPDFSSVKDRLRRHSSAEKFFDPEMLWTPERDFDLCLALDRFDFVLRREMSEAGRFVLHKAD